jgi:hypothetical protein
MRVARPRRQITCEACGRYCYPELQNRDICRDCHRQEPSTCCARCGLMKHRVAEGTGMCPRCAEMLSRPEAVCTRCACVRVIFNREAWLCETCHGTMRQHVRNKDKQIKVECSVCGRMRSSALLSRAICPACWREEHNGRGLCVRCNKLKVIHVQAQCLCKHCYADHVAPKALRDYVANFTTPYRSNKTLFDFFLITIDGESVTAKLDRRLRAFGRFLQTHPLSEPLTWEAIEEALPGLGPTNRNVPKQIRACLLDLGHLRAAKGKLESREAYIERRNALLPMSRAPEGARVCLQLYTGWLWERQTAASSVRDHLEALVAFWSWCDQRGIRPPAGVQASVVDDYLLALYWQWQCSVCQGTTTFEPRDRRGPRLCTYCSAIRSVAKVRRYAQNTVRQVRAKLLVFFDWAKINRMVLVNPVQRKIAAPTPTICHYPLEVIKPLCGYVTAPDADPIEALVLYLILFHALSVWELRHAEMPVLLSLCEDIVPPTLAEAYYISMPKPAPSRGHRSPGRANRYLNFPLGAEPWLKPLLERFQCQRRQTIGALNNQYLLVAPGRARHNTPVSKVFIWQVVRRASLRVLGVACNPNTLRKTAGVMFADRAGAGVLRWLGWHDCQAFAYTWATREILHPQQLDGFPTAEPQLSAAPLAFPAPEGGYFAAAKRAPSSS